MADLFIRCEMFSKIKALSGDPNKPVQAYAFYPNTLKSGKEVYNIIAWGYNDIIFNIKEEYEEEIREEIFAKPIHPAKNVFMKHAEIDMLESLQEAIKERSEEVDIDKIIVICSLQPCMDCIKCLVDFGIKHLGYLEENRHQDQQEAIKPYINYLFDTYKKVTPEIKKTVLKITF